MTTTNDDLKPNETNAAADGEPAATPGGEAIVPAPELSPAELEELKVQAAQAAEHWDKLLRTTADFDNFRKRAARERQDLLKYGADGLMHKLIPVLDNFEMAMAATNSADSDTVKSLQAGVAMIHQQLKTALTEAGLKEVNATNQVFDPNYHEAVSQEESAEVPEGHVLRQLRKGYQLHDRLLRPASVIVARKPAAATNAAK
jgi:molecular chaperone GrpE